MTEAERKTSIINEEAKQISFTVNVKSKRYNNSEAIENNSPVSKKTKLSNSSVDNEVNQTDINVTTETNVNNDNDDQNKLLRTNFDVYIQSLVSLVFASNFLETINRENGKY